jgi:hypothetical protein
VWGVSGSSGAAAVQMCMKQLFWFPIGRDGPASVVWWSEFLATDPEVPGSKVKVKHEKCLTGCEDTN